MKFLAALESDQSLFLLPSQPRYFLAFLSDLIPFLRCSGAFDRSTVN